MDFLSPLILAVSCSIIAYQSSVSLSHKKFEKQQDEIDELKKRLEALEEKAEEGN